MKKDSLKKKIVYYEKKISSFTNPIIFSEIKNSDIIKQKIGGYHLSYNI
jgi:hypothetical protein